MNGLFQSIRFDLAVFICALIAMAILALMPPLILGGVGVWFFCLPLFLALRLMQPSWFLLLLGVVALAYYLWFGNSPDRFLAVTGSTILLFLVLLVVRLRLGNQYGLGTVFLLHMLIDLPLTIISRQLMANISFTEACFSVMGYSLGLLLSLVVSSIILVVASSREWFAFSGGDGVNHFSDDLSRKSLPTSGRVVELVIASLLFFYLAVHLDVAGDRLLQGQKAMLRSDAVSDYRNAFFDYRLGLHHDVVRAVDLNLNALTEDSDSWQGTFDLRVFKDLIAPITAPDQVNTFSVAVVEDGIGVIAKDASFSSAEVEDALGVAEEFSNEAIVYLLKLLRSDGSISPVLVIRHKRIQVLIAYSTEKALVDFQRLRLADTSTYSSPTRSNAIQFSEISAPLETLLPTNASYALVDQALVWDNPLEHDAGSIKAIAYQSMRLSRFPHWLPFGRNTSVWFQIPNSVVLEVREFFLAPETYYWTGKYWDYFGGYLMDITLDVFSTLLLFLMIIPMSQFLININFSPLAELTNVLTNWGQFRGAQFGASTAFQTMNARRRSGIAEINGLQRSFQRLAQEMTQDERRLTTIAANYDELLRSLPLGVLAVDYQSRVHFLNDALLEILGQEKEAIGLVKAHALAMLEKTIPVEEWQLIRENQPPKSLLLVVTHRLNQQGEDAGAWVIVTDLTLQKQTSSQLIQASKLATLGEMSTGMAHELNQPLNVIALAVSNLRIISERGKMSLAAVSPKLDRIETAVRRAAVIIDHMRAYGRVAGDESVVLDIGDVIHGLCMLLRDQLALVEIQLVNRVDRHGIYVKGNAIQFEQVIINVINNARDAIRDSENPAGEIVIESLLQRSRVLVRISDTGPGIPTDALPHVFEPFFTTKPVGKGTGLGGSISYGIIREMHGDIWAENTAGGARITVSLPLVEDSLGDDASRESAGGAIK